MKKQWVSILLTAITFAMGVATAGSAQMAFIGALIGAAASIAGSVANGVMSSKANSKAEVKEREREQMKRKYLEQQLKEENEDYAANINERAMYRYTAQYNANKLSDALREQLKNSRGRQAVMGGTDEQIAAQMESNANAMSDYYGQVEMAEEQYKKQLEQEHKQRKRELNAAAADVTDQALAHQADYQRAKGQNIANAVGSGINALGSIAAGLDTNSIKGGSGASVTTTGGKIGYDRSRWNGIIKDLLKKNKGIPTGKYGTSGTDNIYETGNKFDPNETFLA